MGRMENKVALDLLDLVVKRVTKEHPVMKDEQGWMGQKDNQVNLGYPGRQVLKERRAHQASTIQHMMRLEKREI